jgi:hypothetical protein
MIVKNILLIQLVHFVSARHKSKHKFIFSDFRNYSHNLIRWAGHVAQMGEKRNAYRLLVGKPEGKRATRKTKT